MNDIKTSTEELIALIKGGHFFNFFIAYALNKGFKDALKSGNSIRFSVGDYDVEFDKSNYCFTASHKIYFARIIQSYPDEEVVYIGDDENEVINELLTEFKKEIWTIQN